MKPRVIATNDGDKLSLKWWQYADADSAVATVKIVDADSLNKANFIAPSEHGKQVHIIIEVTDDGMPALTGYQRILYHIK